MPVPIVVGSNAAALADIADVNRADAIDDLHQHGFGIVTKREAVSGIEEHFQAGAFRAPRDLEEARCRLREVVELPHRPACVVLVEQTHTGRCRVGDTRGQSFDGPVESLVLSNAGMRLTSSQAKELHTQTSAGLDPRPHVVSLFRAIGGRGMREIGIGDKNGDFHAGIGGFSAKLIEVCRHAAGDVRDTEIGAIEVETRRGTEPVTQCEPARFQIWIERNRQTGQSQRTLTWTYCDGSC